MVLYIFSPLSDLGQLAEAGSSGADRIIPTSTDADHDVTAMATDAYERRITKLEQENKELNRKLQGTAIHLAAGSVTSTTSPIYIF